MLCSDMSHHELEYLWPKMQVYRKNYLQWVRTTRPYLSALEVAKLVFNPLSDFEAAMWLSAELRMSVKHNDSKVHVALPGAGATEQVVPYTDDIIPAMCLAVVRTAAAAVANEGACTT